MKKLFVIGLALAMTGCVSLSHVEKNEIQYLAANGIDVNHGSGGFEAPNSVVLAGVLNVLPGFGNFYLALGQGGEGIQGVYGVLNLLFWPLSVVWGIPQATIDANTLNKREMLDFYRYNQAGKEELQRRGLELK